MCQGAWRIRAFGGTHVRNIHQPQCQWEGERQGELCPELAQSPAAASPGHRKLGIFRSNENTELCWNSINSLMLKVTAKSRAHLSPSTMPSPAPRSAEASCCPSPVEAALS